MALDPRAPRDDGDVMVEINTTPLIDVMLVLLIMLIITIPVQTHAVRMDMPRDTAPPASVLPEVVNLVIDFDGTMTWNGAEVPDRSALEARLKAAAAEQPQPELHIAPNSLAPYAAVAEVLAEAQRLGVVKLGLVGAERFIE